MSLLNAVVAIAALIVLFSLWGGVHLLARHRMGERKLGCKGPTSDAWGNAVCCNSGEVCEKQDSCDRHQGSACEPSVTHTR